MKFVYFTFAINAIVLIVLTTGTFAALAADPELGRAEALQKSMLALIEDTETDYFAHPFFWAPFVVVGEGGRVSAH